jgi:hypothetical protein
MVVAMDIALGQGLVLDESKVQVLVLGGIKLTNEGPAEKLLIELNESEANALGIDNGSPTLREAGNKGRDRLIWTLFTCHELLQVHDTSSRGGVGTLELTPHEEAIVLVSAVNTSFWTDGL